MVSSLFRRSYGWFWPRITLARRSNGALKLALAIILVLAGGFIALPVLSLFIKSSPVSLARSLQDSVVRDALALSLLTSACTTGIVILLGTPLSYLNARFHYFGKEVLDTLLDLPVVLPPAVAGIALLMAFGRTGVLGQHLNALGISIAFTTLAVILAQVFVSAPFYLRQARTSFEDVDPALESAARTLGSSPVSAFFQVTIPLACNGLVSGAVMTFARALGEFGATMMFAGNFQGRTQTMPLAIYAAMQGDLDAALCLSIALVVISFLVIALVRMLTGRLRGC